MFWVSGCRYYGKITRFKKEGIAAKAIIGKTGVRNRTSYCNFAYYIPSSSDKPVKDLSFIRNRPCYSKMWSEVELGDVEEVYVLFEKGEDPSFLFAKEMQPEYIPLIKSPNFGAFWTITGAIILFFQIRYVRRKKLAGEPIYDPFAKER